MTIIINRDPSPAIDVRAKPIIDAGLRDTAKVARFRRDIVRDSKSRTPSRSARHVGEIPIALFMEDPDWFNTPGNGVLWLKAHPEFRVGTDNL